MRDRKPPREAVEAQARALVEGDLALFASYAAPHALPALHRAHNTGRMRRFDIVEVEEREAYGSSTVRFRGSSSYAIRGVWELTDQGWKAVALDLPDASLRGSWWRRMLRVGHQTRALPQREDLS